MSLSYQLSTAVRNARLDTVESTIGTSAQLKVRTGAPPANCAAADTGTVLATMTLPADWMAAAAAGSKALSGTWQDASADATGTAGHFRIYDSAGTTCHVQGTAGQNVVLTTSALTAANGNVLTFAATTGVVAGMNVSGTGVVAGSTVAAVTGTTVTLSMTSTAGVASGASITFSYDLSLDNASIAAGQSVTVASFNLTDANA
jgi:hypothetical protein